MIDDLVSLIGKFQDYLMCKWGMFDVNHSIIHEDTFKGKQAVKGK